MDGDGLFIVGHQRVVKHGYWLGTSNLWGELNVLNQLLGLNHASPCRLGAHVQAAERQNGAAFPGVKKGEIRKR
jgi:hypothetical protein